MMDESRYEKKGILMSCILSGHRSNRMACDSVLLGLINWQGSVWKVKEGRV